jgi:hypothetical protein
MLKPRWILLLLPLFASPAVAQSGEVIAYISARADYQKAFDALWKTSAEGASKADAAFVVRYEPLLRSLVGPIEIGGGIDSTIARLGSMHGVYENNPAPDGILYRLKDRTQAFATDTAVFRAWAVQTGKSGDTDELLKSGAVPSWIFDAATPSHRCGYAAVNPRGRQLISALIVEYSQDKGDQCSMDAIVVSVVVGGRLMIIQRRLPQGTKPNPSLAASIAQALVDRLPER